jgi:hypothetical protein
VAHAAGHCYGLKVGQAPEVLGRTRTWLLKLHEEAALEIHGAMLRAAT